MFFILSKILYGFIKPVNWILALGLWYYLSKSKPVRKRLLFAMVVLALIFSNDYLFRATLLAWQPPVAVQKHDKTYTAGILLTGMGMTNKKKETYFGGNADRFVQACKLYHSGTIKKIIISGGDGSIAQKNPKEADFLRGEFLAQAIPDSALIVENQSRTTYENAVGVKKVIDSMHLEGSFVLITSARHMRRAQQSFARAGIMADAHASNFEVLENDFGVGSLIPNLELLKNWESMIKEMIGLLAYRLTGKA